MTNPLHPHTTFDLAFLGDVSLLSIDERLGRFARAHDGIFTTDVATILGVSNKALRVRREKGQIELVHPHVHRFVGAPVTARQLLRAACWTLPSLTVVSHRSAAAMWGLDLPGDPVVEVSMNRPHAPDLDGVVLHRSADLANHHITELEGLFITTVARTLIDLGAVEKPWVVERALEVASSRRLVTIAEVRTLREELSKRGRNGVGIIGTILEQRGLADVDSDSVLESMFAKLWRDSGIDGLVFQYAVTVAGRQRFIDFAVPDLMIAFELKGYGRHSQWDVFKDDCVRAAELTLLGWQVIEFTWEDVATRPGYVVRVIREAIRQATVARSGVTLV